jgi:hypothetical protein
MLVSKKTVLLLTVPIRIGDKIDATIRLALSPTVNCSRVGEARFEERAGEQRASVLETV